MFKYLCGFLKDFLGRGLATVHYCSLLILSGTHAFLSAKVPAVENRPQFRLRRMFSSQDTLCTHKTVTNDTILVSGAIFFNMTEVWRSSTETRLPRNLLPGRVGVTATKPVRSTYRLKSSTLIWEQFREYLWSCFNRRVFAISCSKRRQGMR